MNPRVKELWLTALRSGEYTQADGYLKSERGYCCLGVLCEIAVAEGVIESWGSTTGGGVIAYGDPDPERSSGYVSDTSLPEEVMVWADLQDHTPEVYHPRDFHHPDFADAESRSVNFPTTDLATLNDDEGLTFEEIADVISEQL